MEAPKTIDPIALTHNLHETLSKVTVSGHENIHNMDYVLSGLIVLLRRLQEDQKKQLEAAQTAREAI